MSGAYNLIHNIDHAHILQFGNWLNGLQIFLSQGCQDSSVLKDKSGFQLDQPVITLNLTGFNVWAITCATDVGFLWSNPFWKEETKIYNFVVQVRGKFGLKLIDFGDTSCSTSRSQKTTNVS